MAEHLQAAACRALSTDSSADPTLSVVIPALNEESGISGILEGVFAIQEALNKVGIGTLEVVVVDDGSVDKTAQIAEQTPGVRLVQHRVNRGYGAAIKTGFGRASGEFLAFLDADSTYPPEFLVSLCEVAIRENADIVIGSRRSGTQSSMPPIRRLGNLIWSSLLSFIGDSKVQDPASGMRVLRRNCLRQLYPLPDGLNFTPVMSTRALHEGLKVIEIPVPYHERTGRSKLSVVRDGTRFLRTIIWTALQYNPARILELVGFGALTGAGAIGLTLIIARMNGITQLSPWGVFAVYCSLILAVGGVSVFSLGISFNYLVALFHRRPIRQANLLSRIAGPSLERHFGWAGVALAGTGMTLGVVSLVLGLHGWEITRLWFWLLGSALFLLVGVQLILFWMLIRVLDTLSEREERIGEDLTAVETGAAIPVSSRPLMTGSD
jgi:Glycosyl transferase family 2